MEEVKLTLAFLKLGKRIWLLFGELEKDIDETNGCHKHHLQRKQILMDELTKHQAPLTETQPTPVDLAFLMATSIA